MISQELIYDESFNSLSIEAQLLFIRMLAVSDDCGIVPAAEYTLLALTNPPDKIKKNLSHYINEIIKAEIGRVVSYEGKKYFLFKKDSFERYQSYIINKRVTSEYLRISSAEFDKIDWDSDKTKGIKNASIPVEAKKHFANLYGLNTGKVVDSKEAKCSKCDKIGEIHNNGFGYITLSGLHFDHIVPHRFGGSNKTENFQILCPPCNQIKKYADIEKFKDILLEELNCESNDNQLESNCEASAIISNKYKVISKEYKEEAMEDGKKHELQTWIDENCKNVLCLENQLTVEDCDKLLGEFGMTIVTEVLMDMDNYKPLLKKYKNVGRTLRNWIKIRQEKNNGINKGHNPKNFVSPERVKDDLSKAF